jgi:hypothetical protein
VEEVRPLQEDQGQSFGNGLWLAEYNRWEQNLSAFLRICRIFGKGQAKSCEPDGGSKGNQLDLKVSLKSLESYRQASSAF